MKSFLITLSVISLTALLGCQKTPEATSASTATSALPGAVASTSTLPPVQVEKPAPILPAALAVKKYDGPLGLAMGITEEEIQALGFKDSGKSNGTYYGTPPMPADGFNFYIAKLSPTLGLCRLMGFRDISVVNNMGDQLKEATDDVAELVSMKYGSGKKIEYLPEIQQRNPEFWMLGLHDDSVIYSYTWKKDLPNSLQRVEVYASASEIYTGKVIIDYRFSNVENCYQEDKKKKSKSF